VQACDPAQDRDKSAMKKLYEKVITGVATVMKNVPRKEVATEIDISGRLDNPQTSTVQAIIKLIQNAFIKAILPGSTEKSENPDGAVSSKEEHGNGISNHQYPGHTGDGRRDGRAGARAEQRQQPGYGQRPGLGLRRYHAEPHARPIGDAA
jgi:hypothetical protein